MTKRPGILVCAALATIGMFAPRTGGNRAQAHGSACDYACLTGMVDQYMKALVAHDPKQIPVAEHVKFTENTIPLKLGDALWGTISGMGSYKIYFADPVSGEAGIEATIRENGTPAIFGLRLRVVNHKITEVETMVHRTAKDAEAFEKTGPKPLWSQSVQGADRTSREEMLKDAKAYFNGILHGDGNSVPFDPDCNRTLDGYQDTNKPDAKGWFDMNSFKPDAMGIRQNMNTGIWAYIKSINPQRYSIIDEKMGVVFGFFMFNHPGNIKYANVPGVGKVPMPPVTQRPSSVEIGEFFKIEHGKIREIEGLSIALPYGQHSGWEAAD